MTGAGDPTGRDAAAPIDLAAAMRRVREMQADRGDVVVDMAHAARARLELLAHDLEPLIRDLPVDSDLFDFGLSSGETPRLWLDAVAHVRMGRDRRVYEFVKDTRNGRIVLAMGEDRREIGRRVADYVAERLLERQRIVEGDGPALSERVRATTAAGRRAVARWLVPAALIGAGAILGVAAMLAWTWIAA